jgi:hypothetical protein
MTGFADRVGYRKVSGPKSFQGLTPAQRQARSRALNAVAQMRASGMSLTEAARHAGTTPATVHRYVAPALTSRGNRVVATGGDRLYRRMTVLTPQGRQEVDLRGSRVASLVGRHHDAVRRYIRTGDPRPLAWFAGKRVGGVELASDPKDIETAAIRGDLDVDDIYPDR